MHRFDLIILVALSSTAQAAPWVLDASSTELVVKVWKAGAGASLAHDHVVRASKFSGKASLADAKKPESLKLQLQVEVAGLTPDEPAMRTRHHLPNTPVAEVDRKKIRDTLLSDVQLDAAKFPFIAFTLSKVSREEDGALQGEGKLTLHGVTRELKFPLEVKAGARKVEGDARVRIKTSDFGVEPYSTALGLIKNQDEVELVVHLVLKR